MIRECFQTLDFEARFKIHTRGYLFVLLLRDLQQLFVVRLIFLFFIWLEFEIPNFCGLILLNN